MQLKRGLKQLSWSCANIPKPGNRFSRKSGLWDTIPAIATVRHRPACLHTNHILIGDCSASSIYCCQVIWETWKSAHLRCFSQDSMSCSSETSTSAAAKVNNGACQLRSFGDVLVCYDSGLHTIRYYQHIYRAVNQGNCRISPVSNGLTHLGIWDRCSFNSSRTAVRRRASALFASSYNKRDAIVLEEQERGASQVLRHSEIERNGREAKQFARRGQGKREGWMVWTLRPVGVCVGAIG